MGIGEEEAQPSSFLLMRSLELRTVFDGTELFRLTKSESIATLLP